MKRSFKQNSGFTLVELIVAIAVAAIVTAAATTVLVLALRVNRQTGDTASQLITVRSLLSTMEKVASEGNIKTVQADFNSWELIDSDEKVVFSYDSEGQTISSHGTVVLTGVYASHATYDKGLLTISIETSDGIYSSSVYCRTGLSSDGETVGEGSVPSIPGESTTDPDSLDPGTLAYFIAVLKSQYGSEGEIIGSAAGDVRYFSEWYIGTDNFNPAATGMSNLWNPKTPWCACFVSWALEKSGVPNAPRFAEVDDFMKHFVDETNGSAWYDSDIQSDMLKPGDLVFFDWIVDNTKDPQHVGVVLGVQDGRIYTIEGNSAGRVMIRSYPINSQYILGYGVLPWAS